MTDTKLTEEDIQGIFSSKLEKVNNEEAWVILFDNQRYKTKKGKSLWKKRNHASSAFRNDMEQEINKIIKLKLGLYSLHTYQVPECKFAFENFRDALISNGRLKIVNINE